MSSAPYVPRSRGREITYQADLEGLGAGARRGGPAGAAGGRRRGGRSSGPRCGSWSRSGTPRSSPRAIPGHFRNPRPTRTPIRVRGAGPRWSDSPTSARSGCSRPGSSSRTDAGPDSGPGLRGPGPAAGPGAQAQARASRPPRMIWVTSYRLSPSLRAISSGRRPCWLYRTASRRCDARARQPRLAGGAGCPGAGCAWAGVPAVFAGRSAGPGRVPPGAAVPRLVRGRPLAGRRLAQAGRRCRAAGRDTCPWPGRPGCPRPAAGTARPTC